MPYRNKSKTRRHGRHHHETKTMSTIYTRQFVAREVAAGRLTDQALQRQGRAITEDAVARVARRLGLEPEPVAQIAIEESHGEALRENAEREAGALVEA